MCIRDRGNTDMSNAKIVLTDKNNTLTKIDVLDVAHGGTGTSTLGNFVDLTSDQTITGNKTFTGILRRVIYQQRQWM